ncbi:NAD(P)-binding protein [Coprinopsis marcescibilis]|uniref:NAD(P)-binding protein n=1 Tax=Coprinopsis marcescibilis TaxID=230819 RepID=A0A5C3L1F5_COPMA|nr:NAD(P)-binding protein [Coprinopsis marcescibilis]
MSNASNLPFPKPPSVDFQNLHVGFVGLGNIGFAMAKNLATNGPKNIPNFPPVTIWNRTASKAETLVAEIGKEKAVIAATIEEIVTKCDVIVVNLANDDVVRVIYSQFCEVLKNHPHNRHKTFVETSTIYPRLAGDLDKMISVFPRTHLITCPVLGAPAAAHKSELILIMSGAYRSKQIVAYLMVPSVGRKVLDLGGDLEKALTYKLVANSMILGMNEVMAEALTFAGKSGIGSQRVLDLVKDFFPVPSMMAYADRMAHEKFDGSTGFSIDGGIKDAQHIRRLTTMYNCPMPTIDVAHQNLLTARAHFLRQKNEGKAKVDTLDWSAIITGTRASAGLGPLDRSEDAALVEIEES